jgi:hypothetical protein
LVLNLFCREASFVILQLMLLLVHLCTTRMFASMENAYLTIPLGDDHSSEAQKIPSATLIDMSSKIKDWCASLDPGFVGRGSRRAVR